MIGTVDGVSALIPGVGEIDGSSTPTDVQVAAWLVESTMIVGGALLAGGYSATVDEDAAIYPVLEGMTQLYAAANTLQARGLDTLSGGEEMRSEQMFRRFYAQLKILAGGNLDALGVTVLPSASGNRRRRLRTVGIRRIDGYSATYEGSAVAYEYPSE